MTRGSTRGPILDRTFTRLSQDPDGSSDVHVEPVVLGEPLLHPRRRVVV